MTTAENIKLNLDEKAHSYAKIYASLLADEFQRKRAYASLVSLYSLIGVLEQTEYTVQKSMTLFRNPQINEQYEISDLYVNGWHIDIRVVTGGDAVLLPKIHFDSDIVPDFYVVVKVDNLLQNAEVLGIIDTENLEKEDFDNHYFSVPFSSLISYNSFLAKLVIEKNVPHTEEEHELFRNSYINLLDNNLDIKTKNKVLKHLFSCSLCRTEFCCFTGFEMVCCHASSYPEILEDHTLGYIGAQNVEDKKYEGKEETVYIGTDEETLVDEQPQEVFDVQADEIVESIETVEKVETNEIVKPVEKVEAVEVGETVSDILDGLFHVDEITVAENDVEEKPIEIEETPSVVAETEEIVEETQENNEVAVNEVEVNEEATTDATEETTVDITEETTVEISSIDDILEEVCNDIDSVQPQAENVKEEIIVIDEDTELQQIDDSLFMDVPRNFPEIWEKKPDLQVIADEATEVYGDKDIEIVSDDQKDNDELLVIDEEKDDVVTEVDLELEQDLDTNNKSEIETIEKEIEEVYPTDEEFIINDDESEIENIEDEIIDEATMLSQEETVQKVIVDYDDYGEPIYSYVTGVEQEENKEESILEEDVIEEYKDNSDSEIEDISNIDETVEEEYESVYATDEETSSDDNVEYDVQDEKLDTEEYLEMDVDDEELENENVSDLDEEIENEDEEPIDVEEELEDDEQPSIIDDILYNDAGQDEDIDDELEDNEDEMNSNEEYDEDEYDETFIPEDNVKKSPNPIVIILSLLIFLGLAGAGAFFFLNKDKAAEEQKVIENANENAIEIAENPAVNDMFEQPVENDGIQIPTDNNEQSQGKEEQKVEEQTVNNQEQTELPVLPNANASKVLMPDLTEGDLIKPIQRNSNGDVNKTIVNAFATNTSPVSLRALNWFCASELFSDKNFKNYLQNIDNTLKQNLRNNFMNLVESSPKDTVVAKFAVDNRGNLKKNIISETSGSTDIDNVVLQSIKETFEQEKSQILNDTELKQDMYYLKVAIKL